MHSFYFLYLRKLNKKIRNDQDHLKLRGCEVEEIFLFSSINEIDISV